jgi:hypothetical protein
MLKLDQMQRSLAKQGYSWIKSSDLTPYLQSFDTESKFINSWFDLEPDLYLKDPKHFRFRRYGEFIYSFEDDSLNSIPTQPFYQSVKYNRYAGGIKRKFTELSDEDKNSNLLKSLIKADLNICNVEKISEKKTWKIGIHQIRLSTSDQIVYPAPEGVHSDGHEYLVIHLVDRVNIDGGECTIYDDSEKPINKGILLDRWDSVAINDGCVKHGISPIVPTMKNLLGYRDILIVDINSY